MDDILDDIETTPAEGLPENGIAEASEEPAVTEEQLLEIARTQGLLDSSFDHTDEGQADAAEAEAAEAEGSADGLSAERECELMAAMETVLFMSDKPVSLPKLRATIDPEISLSTYRALMARARTEFGADQRGIEIAEVALGFQLRTKPQMASILRRMVKTQPMRLSPATMEVLAVVAYKQPVTKDDVDVIRGVDSGYVIRNLMERRLVKICGRSELPGRPMLYGTTHEFLELFNLKDAKQLPPLHEIEAMVAASEVGFEEKTQAVMDEFGKMVASADRILFDDSKVDGEIESLRAEIASIPTSTKFIDDQKAKEKRDARIAELAPLGLTLDNDDNEVLIGSFVAEAEPLPPWLQPPAAEPVVEIEAQPEEQAEPVIDAPIEAQAEEAPAETAIEAESVLVEPIEAETAAAEAMEADAVAAEPVMAEPMEAETIAAEHQPSAELETQAAEAQWERHAAILAEAIGEAQVAAVEDAAAVEAAPAPDAEAIPESAPEAELQPELDRRHEHEPESSV